MNNQTSRIIGYILLFLGIGYLGDQFHFWSFHLFFRGWWTLFLIVPGIVSIINSGVKSQNTLLIVVGIYLFMWSNHFFRFRFTLPLLIAVLLIYFGIKLIFSKQTSSKSDRLSKAKEPTHNEHVVVRGVFSNETLSFHDDIYTCKIDSTFSSLRLDLRNANIKELKVIDIDCFFGNIDIYLPQNINISVKKDNFFGTCNTPKNRKENEIEVYIRESCILGSIQIIRLDK